MRDRFRCSTLSRSGLAALALALVFVFAGPLQGEEGEPAPVTGAEATAAEGTPEAAAEAPSPLRAMRVYRDPATGRVTHEPPPGAARGLSEALQRRVSRSSQGLASRTLANGASVLDLQGRFLQLTVAKRAADGSVESACVTNAGTAESFLAPEAEDTDEEDKEERHD